MSVHLVRQIDKMKKRILHLGALVEQSVRNSIVSIVDRDAQLAISVIDSDNVIDGLEIEIEEECLQTLALYQPVAHDLRYVVAVLKINNDLERIADLSVNIAEHAVVFANEPPVDKPPFNMTVMANRVQGMLTQSLDALVNQDIKLAQGVRVTEDEIDEMHSQVYDVVSDQIRVNPTHLEQLLRYIAVSRCLERIADHAENIAEDVMYMVRGVIYRHEHIDKNNPVGMITPDRKS